MKKKQFVVVGAGLFGITLAQQLSAAGSNILLIDSRNHIGGNCYDYVDDETGIVIHKYGPHIFHVQDNNILNYIKKFTSFNNYKHHVYAKYKDRMFNFPINISTINTFYGINLAPNQVLAFLKGEANLSGIDEPRNMEEKVISLIGNPLYEAFFKEYTVKQWGRYPKDLPASIVNRIPIKTNYDMNYYKKPFNGIPSDGYSAMFNRMLDNKNIAIELSVNFFSHTEYFLNKGLVIFTGPIDAFFNYEYGNLEYRSLQFNKELYDVDDWQGNSVINYPELKYEYTRICEPKHFYPERWNEFSPKKTLIFKEIPFSSSDSEPYYPIQDAHNVATYQRYAEESKKLSNVFFGGRLGEYKYYDMEDTIQSALALSRKLLN